MEFFEKKKFGLKTARRYKDSPTKRKQSVGQDLKELMTVTNVHAEHFSFMKPVSRPVKNMDFDKLEKPYGKRLTEDVHLGSSPIQTPSQIQLMEAKEYKGCNANKLKKNYSCQVTEEEDEIIYEVENHRHGSISKERHGTITNKDYMHESDIFCKPHKIETNSISQKHHFANNLKENNRHEKFDVENYFRPVNICSSDSMMQTWDVKEKHTANSHSPLCKTVCTQTFPANSLMYDTVYTQTEERVCDNIPAVSLVYNTLYTQTEEKFFDNILANSRNYNTVYTQTEEKSPVDASTSPVKFVMVDNETQYNSNMYIAED